MELDNIRVTTKTLLKVKEIVDFIYEATVAEGGYNGGWAKYSSRFRHVSTILIRRGVIKREGNQQHTIYTWTSNHCIFHIFFFKFLPCSKNLFRFYL